MTLFYARQQQRSCCLQTTTPIVSIRRRLCHCNRVPKHITHATGDSPQQPEEPAEEAQRTKALLDRLFYSSTAPEPLESSGDPATGAGQEFEGESRVAALPGLIQDVPLWRVQWAAVPGFQEVYHVHVPHYCDMFSRLFAGPRPWRFGHLYLPLGSPNLGNPQFELAPGSQAPLVGTLMEVLRAVQFSDGRLLILAVGVGRFKVVRSRQAVPHSRADVVLLPDWEEVQQCQATAMDALEAGASKDLPVAAAMQASVVAAEQAAVAASKVWWEYEVGCAAEAAHMPRQPDLIVLANEGEARAFGRLLVAIGNTSPVAVMPMHGPGSAEEEEWPSSSDSDEEGEGEGEWPSISEPQQAAAVAEGAAGGGGEPARRLNCTACAAAAEEAALAAATQTIQALSTSSAAAADAPPPPTQPPQLSQGLGFGSLLGRGADAALLPGFSLGHASAGTLQGINSTSDRGVPQLPAAAPRVVAEAEGDGDEAPWEGEDDVGASRSVALRLEELTWHELDAVQHLAARIRNKAVPLPDGLEQLRPAGVRALAPRPLLQGEVPATIPAAPEASLHPSYPAMRRVQRLSYVLASVLADISNSEGRQMLLEAPSISARLRISLAALRRHRSVLAAVVAVQGLSGEGGK